MTYLNHVRFVAHVPDLCHVPHLLVDQSALKHDKHHQSEDGIVPVLVQAPVQNGHTNYHMGMFWNDLLHNVPKSNTKNLKDKEWSHSSLFEEFREFWNGHVDGVVSVEVVRLLQIIVGFVTYGFERSF